MSAAMHHDLMDLMDLCALAYAAADDPERQERPGRWVMDLASYEQIRAECEALTGQHTDPDTWVPDPADRLFAIPVDVRDHGGEPHLEVTG